MTDYRCPTCHGTGVDLGRLEQDLQQAAQLTTPAGPLAVTVREAGYMLSVSETTVYGLIRQGTLRSVKIGGQRRVPVDAVEALLDTDTPDGDAPCESSSATMPAVFDRSRLKTKGRQVRALKPTPGA